MATSRSLPNILEPKDHGDPKPSEDGGKDLGEALSKFDFSKIDFASDTGLGSQGPDHSEVHAALASMSSDEALDYAIGQMGPADHPDAGHFDAGQFDNPVDTSHDT